MTDQNNDASIDALKKAGWEVTKDGSTLSKTFKFGNFPEAFGFMTRAAFYAEKWDHHPDWSNTYSTVEVNLTTHDTGGLSDLDIKLATKMDEVA